MVKEERVGLIISLIIVSLGSFIIYIKDNPFKIDEFILWLPVSWLLVLCLMFGFKIFLSNN